MLDLIDDDDWCGDGTLRGAAGDLKHLMRPEEQHGTDLSELTKSLADIDKKKTHTLFVLANSHRCGFDSQCY